MANKPTDGPDFKDWDWQQYQEWKDRIEREEKARERRKSYINKF